MDKSYSIFFNKAEVGTGTVETQGLYYRFRCRCRLPKDRIYVIWVSSGEHREKLGVCVPSTNGFLLDAKVPIKRFYEGELSFSVEPKDLITKDSLIPLIPEEPFAYLDQLDTACFTMESGQPVLSIKSCHQAEEGFECP